MKKVFILVIFKCEGGVTSVETSLFDDKVEAEVRLFEEYRQAQSMCPKAVAYDGWDGLVTWFEVGYTTDKRWFRGEIQQKTA